MPKKNSQAWRKLTKEQQVAQMEKGKRDAEQFAQKKPSPYTRGGA